MRTACVYFRYPWEGYKRGDLQLLGYTLYDYTDVVFVKILLQLQNNLVCVEDHVKVKEIVDKFKLTDFAGKPKYIIFQACREGLEQPFRHAADVSDANGQLYGDDKPLSAKCHQDADMLLSFATTPDSKAYRKVPHEENQWIGSWFIRALLDVFEKKYQKTDVMKMLEEVRRNLKMKMQIIDHKMANVKYLRTYLL
ncbi:unnamed protein product [Mytilus edulis]|uniref:Caspase family p10 domain-containing protein n=1 Tax=Mytilus edulis TaxID=6550 RepID=A0A8S3QCG1_MYTED|nr:unnamed protein product [Mytilus edulis]